MSYLIHFIETDKPEETRQNWLEFARITSDIDAFYLYKVIQNINSSYALVVLIQSENMEALLKPKNADFLGEATLCDIFFTQGKAEFNNKNIILFNPFEIREEEMDSCYDMWFSAHQHMAQKSGFVGVNFFRRIDKKSKYKFINMAQWERVENIVGAIDDPFYKEHRDKAKKYKMHPSLNVLDYAVTKEDKV